MRKRPIEHEGSKGSDLDMSRLRKGFNEIILSSKAKELGVDEEDLVVTVRGGKRIFTSRQKLAEDLQRQRSITKVETRRTQRAIRGGEDSIIGDIESRLEDCFLLLSLLTRHKLITPMDDRDMRRALKDSADNAIQFSKELQYIEAEIERKKANDPLLSRLDGVAQAIYAARERGDERAAAQLSAACREDLARYESRRRALGPDIQSALHCRHGLLRAQRRIVRTQIGLYSQWAWTVQKSANEVLGRRVSRDLNEQIVSCINDLTDRLETAERLQAARKVEERSPDKPDKDVQAQNKLLDGEVARLRDAVRGVAEHLARLETLLDKASPDEKAGRRMTFIERKE